MSATQSSSQSISTGHGDAVPAVSAGEIAASCRFPLLLLFVSAALWLLASSILGMVATLKFHAPALLADNPCFTYGRVHPAHLNALIYGFALQAGLGVVAWIVAHLGRTRLALTPVIVIGTLLWNLGVALGILGILLGDSTGYEWLEMPRYGSLMIFFGYLAIGLGLVMTFHERRERRLYTAHWFLIAAVFWFPWIHSTANFLLVAMPVRGVLQAAVDWWYMNNLAAICFGFIGLGAIFYFVPKISKRPLYSHYLGMLAFWGIAIFGSWGGIATGTPLPAWMSALSTVAAVLTIVPILGVAMNIQKTLAGGEATAEVSLKFFRFGAGAYVIAGIVASAGSLARFSRITNFTWFIPAQAQLVLYGFFAMTMFGAIYYIVPRLTQIEFCSRKLITAHFVLAAGGIVLYALPLALGGLQQGAAMNDPNKAFLDIVVGTLPYLRASTTGDLLMGAGHVIFLLNLAGVLNNLRKACVSRFLAANPKPAGVTA